MRRSNANSASFWKASLVRDAFLRGLASLRFNVTSYSVQDSVNELRFYRRRWTHPPDMPPKREVDDFVRSEFSKILKSDDLRESLSYEQLKTLRDRVRIELERSRETSEIVSSTLEKLGKTREDIAAKLVLAAPPELSEHLR